jgi:hypothetical protein
LQIHVFAWKTAARFYFLLSLYDIWFIHAFDDRLMTLGGACKFMQPHPIDLMSSFKQKTLARAASKDQYGRIVQPQNKSRFHWRYSPGSKAALELAYDSEALDDQDFLPDLMVGRVRRRA